MSDQEIKPGTPLPWRLKNNADIYARSYFVGSTRGDASSEVHINDAHNAAYIVEACNSYPKLRMLIADTLNVLAEVYEVLPELAAQQAMPDCSWVPTHMLVHGQMTKLKEALNSEESE